MRVFTGVFLSSFPRSAWECRLRRSASTTRREAQEMGRSRFRFGESPFPHFLTCKERRVHTLLDGLEYHKARHNGDRAFQLWQEGSHPKVIETEEVLRQKLEYIHQNPVKRGYVSDPAHWRYSSARNDARIEALVHVSTDW